jgi:hypothetical protein
LFQSIVLSSVVLVTVYVGSGVQATISSHHSFFLQYVFQSIGASSTSHHQVELIIGLSGSVLSIDILVQAITSFNVFTSAPASILSSLVLSQFTKAHSAKIFCLLFNSLG